MNFNIDKLISLIRIAQGNRSLNQFALHCNVDAGNLSRILNKNIKTPPKPGTLKKIAIHSNNRVLYSDLMDAAGYMEKNNATDSEINIGNNILGEKIKELRVNAKKTQSEFGKPYKLNKSTISQYESGSIRPNDELKKRIADDYAVTVDWLLGRTEDPHNVVLTGDQIAQQLKELDVEYIEVIQDAKESGLTAAELKELIELGIKFKNK